MPEVSGRVTIPISQEQAWDYIADMRNTRDWMFGVREVAGPQNPPVKPGDRFRVRLVAGARLAESEWVMGSCERPSLVTSTGRAMGARAELRIECHALGENTTEVVQKLRYELPGGPLGLLAGRLGVRGILEMQAHRSLQALVTKLASGTRSGTRAQVIVEASARDRPSSH
jgi:uncharacterized membrane protein